MTTPCYFLLLLLIRILSTNALPNPQPQQGAVDLRPSSITASPALNFSASYFTAFPSNFTTYSYPSSVLAAESRIYAVYDSYPSHSYGTAQPSDLARVSSYYAAVSSEYAAFTSEYFGNGTNLTGFEVATETIGSSEAAALSSEYAAFTSEEAVYATYTGTSDLFPAETLAPSEAALLSSEYAAFTSVYATYTGTSDLFPAETLAPSEAALLSSEYAAFTSVYATYTGTGDPFANYTAIPLNKSAIPPPTTTIAQAPLRPAVRTSLAATVALTATAQWPALTRVNSSEVYGATCIQYYASGHMYNRTQCDTVVPQICDLLSASDAGTGDVDRWVYAYAPEQQTYGCVMGFWLPGAVRGTRKVPNGEACRNEVFGQMLNLCINAKGDELGLFNAASVNVGTLPGNGRTGTQVEAGAPSYIMALT